MRNVLILKTILSSMLFIIFLFVVPANAQDIYSNDFNAAVGSEWSNTSTDITDPGSPGNGKVFLGQFGSETVSLSLDSLPSHTAVSLSFELLIIHSWDGNGEFCCGPDFWNLSIANGPTLLNTTFSNTGNDGNTQAYPDSYPGGSYPQYTGSVGHHPLYYFGNYNGSSTYNLNFTFAHSASTLDLNFTGILNQPLYDESWGIDNITVSVVPEPISSILFITGGSLLVGRRYTKQKKKA